MADEGMTAHERRCFEHLKQARTLGMSLAEYSRVRGLKVRVLYDVENRLRKKGVISGGLPSQRSAKKTAEAKPELRGSEFVAVRIEPPNMPNFPPLPALRVQHARGHILEFGTWPPADVMAAVMSGGSDVEA
jgi:hypothetical protein